MSITLPKDSWMKRSDKVYTQEITDSHIRTTSTIYVDSEYFYSEVYGTISGSQKILFTADSVPSTDILLYLLIIN